MTLILGFAKGMLPYMLAALPLAVGWRMLRARSRGKARERASLRHELGAVFFALWMVGLLSQAVVPRFIWDKEGLHVVDGAFQNLWETLNLVPGRVFVDTCRAVFVERDWSLLLINVIGNIAMFIPIGFFLPLLWKPFQSAKRAVLAGLCASLFIELCQLPLARETDVDDLWLNTLGAWLGYWTWKTQKIVKFESRWQVTRKDMENK